MGLPVVVIAPGCGAPGRARSECRACGFQVEEELEALEHVWGAPRLEVATSCVVDGFWVRTCEICAQQERLALKQHEFGEWAQVEAPSCTREGLARRVCSACHAAGVANAPKTGDTAAWAPRIQQGLDVLITSALKGKGAMAAQGGGEYSDLEVTKAVVHLANGAGGTFEDPK